MRKPPALLFALFVAMLFPTGPAQAQLDWRKVVPPRINVPGVLPDVVGPRGVQRNLIPSSTLRRAFGALAVGAVGVVILSSLSESQRHDVAQRVNRIVLGPRDREVVEVYEVDKKKKVKIKASPVARKCSFKNDPALIPVAAPGAEEEKPKKPAKGKNEAKGEDGAVAFDQVPKETPCRTIDVEIVLLGDTKSDAPSAAGPNATLVCELSPGDWRPTRFSPKPQPADTPPSDPSCQDS